MRTKRESVTIDHGKRDVRVVVLGSNDTFERMQMLPPRKLSAFFRWMVFVLTSTVEEYAAAIQDPELNEYRMVHIMMKDRFKISTKLQQKVDRAA